MRGVGMSLKRPLHGPFQRRKTKRSPGAIFDERRPRLSPDGRLRSQNGSCRFNRASPDLLGTSLSALLAVAIVLLCDAGAAVVSQSSREARCVQAIMDSEPYATVMARSEGPPGARPLIVEFVMRHSMDAPLVSERIEEALKRRGIGLPRVSLDLDEDSELFDACRITAVPTHIALRVDVQRRGRIVDRLVGNDAGVDRVSRFVDALLNAR